MPGKERGCPVFVAALFTVARAWKQPKCPSTDKIWHIYTMIYLAIKRKKMLIDAITQIDLKTITLSARKPSQKAIKY